MFRDHLANRPSQTGHEMMCSNLSLPDTPGRRLLIEGLMLLGKDRTLMLQSYLILSLKLLHEDWIQRLQGSLPSIVYAAFGI